MSKGKIGKMDKASSVGCLLINIFVLPGLGTLMAGKIRTGILQMSISLLGFLLLFTTLGKLAFVSMFGNMMVADPRISYVFTAIVYLGAPIMIISWIWCLISGIRIVKNSFSK
jgi:TM2 domain-containing membrane protein YozV